MNLQRMIKAAEWMLKIHEAGDAFYMQTWRDGNTRARTYSDLHKCGTPACFAGWLTVSPEFKKAGGTFNKFDGSPIFLGERNGNAIRAYFDCDGWMAQSLVSGYFSSKSSADIAAIDVAEKLLEIVKAEVAK